VPFLRYSMSKIVVTLKSESKVTQGHWKWYPSIDCVWFPLLLSFSNFIPKNAPFLRYSNYNYTIYTGTLLPGFGSPKVIENDTIRSGTHDFLLTFYSNHRPIFRDRRRFQSKIAKFSHPRVFCAPADGVTLGIGYRRRGQKKTRMMGYRVVEKVLR